MMSHIVATYTHTHTHTNSAKKVSQVNYMYLKGQSAMVSNEVGIAGGGCTLDLLGKRPLNPCHWGVILNTHTHTHINQVL